MLFNNFPIIVFLFFNSNLILEMREKKFEIS